MDDRNGRTGEPRRIPRKPSFSVHLFFNILYVFQYTHLFKQLFKRMDTDENPWLLQGFLFLCILLHLTKPSNWAEWPLSVTEIALVSKILSSTFRAYNQQRKWPRSQKRKSLLFLFLFHQLLAVSTSKNASSFKQLL